MRVVLVHDYLNQQGGAERVLSALHQLYPEAPIYTLFYDRTRLWADLQDADIRASLLQRVPFIRRRFKLFFWLYPLVMRSLRLPPCDVVISSSSAYAKAVRMPRRGGHRPLHICYCHTPMRFAWDFDGYIAHETNSRLLAAAARRWVPWLRAWDVRTTRGVDRFIANSSVVRERVGRCYGRDAVVIHPPVDARARDGAGGDDGSSGETAVAAPAAGAAEIAAAAEAAEAAGYFLVVSRLVAYKRIDLAVTACTRLGLPLIVVGRGPDLPRLTALAGATVRFIGWQPDAAVERYMRNCQALLFPGEEDFGITPLEANAHGRPVVALRRGGALDTIQAGVNGVFFEAPTVDALCQALDEVRRTAWDADAIRAMARRFDTAVFRQKIAAFVQAALAATADGAATQPGATRPESTAAHSQFSEGGVSQ